MENTSLNDVMICPHCGSNNCYEFHPESLSFDDDCTGHLKTICHCMDCGKDFRIDVKFNYSIITDKE